MESKDFTRITNLIEAISKDRDIRFGDLMIYFYGDGSGGFTKIDTNRIPYPQTHGKLEGIEFNNWDDLLQLFEKYGV